MGYLGRTPTPSPIDSSDIPANSIDASKIIDGAIAVADVADNAITEAKIADAAVVSLKSGRKNLIINGGFDVWQRGTSITSSGAYNADRWHSSHGASLTTSRQTFTVGQTDVPNNPKYYQRTNGAGLSSGQSFEIRHHIEGVETAANQQVTLSFYAKSSVTATHRNRFWQRFNNFSDYQSGVGNSSFTTTTSWQRFTRTFTLADISGETVVAGANTLTFVIDGEAGFTGTFDLAQVQFEAGSVATDFEHRSYGEELALCQRYFHKHKSGRLLLGWKRHDTAVGFMIRTPVVMRVSPSLSVSTYGIFTNMQSNLNANPSSATIYEYSTSGTAIINLLSSYSGTHVIIPSWEGQTFTLDSEL
jgi:hypothetical protein